MSDPFINNKIISLICIFPLACSVNKEHLTGTVPVNKKHLTGTLKNQVFPKNTPTPSKYPLVRPQKCHSFVQRLRGTLFSEGNQLSVNSPLQSMSYRCLAGNQGQKCATAKKSLCMVSTYTHLGGGANQTFVFSVLYGRYASTQHRMPAPRGMASQHLRTFERCSKC